MVCGKSRSRLAAARGPGHLPGGWPRGAEAALVAEMMCLGSYFFWIPLRSSASTCPADLGTCFLVPTSFFILCLLLVNPLLRLIKLG
jgi:hypothetical protein